MRSTCRAAAVAAAVAAASTYNNWEEKFVMRKCWRLSIFSVYKNIQVVENYKHIAHKHTIISFSAGHLACHFKWHAHKTAAAAACTEHLKMNTWNGRKRKEIWNMK